MSLSSTDDNASFPVSHVTPYQKVAVLGDGQLGQMLRLSGERLGIQVELFSPMTETCAGLEGFPTPEVQVTAEREHWPLNPFTQALALHRGWHNASAFAELTDRRRQKSLLSRLGLPTAPWALPEAARDLTSLFDELGDDIFFKRASGGYDGRGQMRLRSAEYRAALTSGTDTDAIIPEWLYESIAEKAIAFDTEVSLIGARGADGRCVFYRLTENLHNQGVLALSISMPGRFASLQQEAESMLKTLMNHLDYVGVMAMECFVADGKLLINEVAPRVHNSGHWTQAGASISQFELHLRAVCRLPLPQPVQEGTTVMVNLLGLHLDRRWFEMPGCQIHWYGKQWREGRKMGHLNFHHQEPAQLAHWLQQLALPANYRQAMIWAQQRLHPDQSERMRSSLSRSDAIPVSTAR